MKEIEIQCPCCDAKLLVDVRTQTVLRHAQPEQLNEFGKPTRDGGRWDDALERVKERGARAGSDAREDPFDNALRRERDRSKDLDSLFDRARDKVDERRRELEDE
ncbi:MAG: hypothetical protein AAFZ87_02440 [Planctomycetota bacterium]